MPRWGNARGFMQGRDAREGTWRRPGGDARPDPNGNRAARRAAGIRGTRPGPAQPKENPEPVETTENLPSTRPTGATVTGTVYLAARYSRRLELCQYRDVLAGYGIAVPARWLNGEHQLDNQGRPIGETGELMFENGSAAAEHYRERFALDDYEDVLTAQTLIAFTETPRSSNSRGGRHVELGIALGAGKPVIIVGPRENIFCWLPGVRHYDTWADFLADLDTKGRI